ncbi:MAG TPA: peptidylprolyl isomerase [Candidatus Hydrogenedens sp.]|nr:peptidylprolyl isomerase [Candidatus Hydrogenedens sp.]
MSSNKFFLVPIVIVLGIAIIGVYSWYFAQPRLTRGQMEKANEALEKIEQAKELAKQEQKTQESNMTEKKQNETKPETTSSDVQATSSKEIPLEQMPEKAPDTFKVRFECSNGNFTIECYKEWAPIGVEHFYELLKAKFYDGACFFRVVPGFVVQFGIAADPQLTARYGEKTIKDDPVVKSNKKGTITYAKTSLPNSRSTQLFINLGDNTRLDTMGFAPFAQIIEGMEVVERINPKYGESPDQMMIRMQGNAYLKQMFPDLDYIKRTYFVK